MRAISDADSQKAGEWGSVMLEPRMVASTTPKVVPITLPAR